MAIPHRAALLPRDLWSDKVGIGDQKEHPTFVTVTVFWGFWLAILLAIAIWERRISKRSAACKTVLKWNKFGVAIGFGLFYYSYSFISSILHAAGASVAETFYMTDLLFTSTGDVADIWLLGTSYALKFECLTRPDDAKRSLKRRILLIHYSICALLLALWILRLCLNIAYTVRFVEQDDLDDDSIVLYYNANKVEETFNAVFFLAALELLIGSIWALVKSRGRGQPLKADFLFIAMVAVPTFARSTLYLVYNAINLEVSFSSHDYGTQGTFIAEDFFSGLFDVLVFGTVVYVAVRVEEIRAAAWATSPDPAQGPLTGEEADTEMRSDLYKDKYPATLDVRSAGDKYDYINPMAEVHADPLPVPEVHGYSGSHQGY